MQTTVWDREVVSPWCLNQVSSRSRLDGSPRSWRIPAVDSSFQEIGRGQRDWLTVGTTVGHG